MENLPAQVLPLSPGLRNFARDLRSRHTDAERLMWGLLRARRMYGLKFRRQHPVKPYVLDYYCDELHWAIELDGGAHNSEGGRRHDSARTKFLESQGIEVTRYWNHEVLGDLEAVLEDVYRRAAKMKPTHRNHR